MARVVCAICGKFVNTTANNYVFANGIHQHKNCPKSPVLSDEEIKYKKELDLAIEWAFVHKKLGTYDTLNWKLINIQIKKLKDMGYSYKDQLYAFKYMVECDKGYWGYGRLEKFIAKAMELKKREEEYEAKKKEILEKQAEQNKLKVKSKPSFLNF